MTMAAYHRAYRAAHRERVNAATRARRAIARVRGDRSAEYAARNAARVTRAVEPLPPVLPHVRRSGVSLSFWEDELRLDLHQEAELARVEGRDPTAAVTAYRRRELAWRAITAPLILEAAA